LAHSIANPPLKAVREKPQPGISNSASRPLSAPTVPISLANYQHIIWDWNGTLLNDIDLCLSIINKMLRSRSLPPISKTAYLDIFGFPVVDYYQKLGFDFSKEGFEVISTEFITAYEAGRPDCQLMKGAHDILELIHSAGLTQSILSASKVSYLQNALADYQIEDYFCAVKGLDNHHASGKSAIARDFINEIDCHPRSILLIGDTLHDREIAEDLSLNCILIANGHQSIERLSSSGAPVLRSLEELRSVFGG
jgi:phosphoglycolate phosphatase